MKILLTGASGILGHALLPRLAGHEVTSLVHRTYVPTAALEQVSGDILKPNIGLMPHQLRQLTGGLDWIVHCAAETNFSEKEEDIFRLNVDGTANVVEVARETGARLCHLSTAFVRHADLTLEGPRPNAYARSKADAEKVVIDGGISYAIVRPSRIVGDSRTGAISRFQGFHLLFDLLLRSQALVSAASPDALVDFVPVDSVAEAITVLLDHAPDAGAYWVTAGDRALTLRQTLDVEIEEIIRLTGRVPDPPIQVTQGEYESEVKPLLFAATSSDLHPVMDGFIQMMDSLNLEPFPSSYDELARMGLKPMPAPQTTLRRNLLYWARKRGIVRVGAGSTASGVVL